jgi:hypothetical protein
MATNDMIGFMRELEATPPPPFSSPEWRYGPEEDALTFYFRSDESYAHRLNEYVTVFLTFAGDELVGCQVKGVRQRLQADGPFPVLIGPISGKVELGLFFTALAYDLGDARLFELGQKAKGVQVDADTLMPSGYIQRSAGRSM